MKERLKGLPDGLINVTNQYVYDNYYNNPSVSDATEFAQALYDAAFDEGYKAAKDMQPTVTRTDYVKDPEDELYKERLFAEKLTWKAAFETLARELGKN